MRRQARRSIVLGVVLCLALVGYANALTAADIEAAAPHATRHQRIVTQLLASNRLHGRDNDSDDSRLAQHVLIRLLQRFGGGLVVGSGDSAYQQPFVLSEQTGTNLLALIRGRELPNEYVVVGAHYDHLGTRSRSDGHCSARGSVGVTPCNGATDNATGVAAVLGIAAALRSLPEAPRRSVVLALWDAEEDGLVGSRYYVTHPVVPLADTVGYVNFDILGQDLLPSLSTTSFAVGSETGGQTLQAIVERAAALETLRLHEVSYLLGEERSDYKNFVDHRVPTVFLSDATGPCRRLGGEPFGGRSPRCGESDLAFGLVGPDPRSCMRRSRGSRTPGRGSTA
ncbi:MAG: M20/M25/M40 family metallo-hydrolase [Deltaproteobacteria bacterium]|nr:M20/M25/M40 family metallo-hydrolase [Deltaproteobacteria bacterium]